jgi:hypothetical protein
MNDNVVEIAFMQVQVEGQVHPPARDYFPWRTTSAI